MSFLGAFAGRTAQNTDESMREWRRLMLQEDEFKARNEAAKKQQALMEQQFSQGVKEFDWRSSLEKMNFNLEQDKFEATEASTWYNNIKDTFATAAPIQRLEIVEGLEQSAVGKTGSGRDYLTLLRATT